MATMLIVGLATGEPCEFDGQYLVEYDPARNGVTPSGIPMLAHVVCTPNLREALHAPGAELLELWRKVDPRMPRRPDGAPNRPLTAFTVAIK